MIEEDVGDAGNLDVGRDSDGGDGDLLAKVGVDEEEAVDGAIEEELRVLLDEIGAAEVADGEVEVAGLEEVLLDAEHEAGKVAFAELRNYDSYGVGEPGAEHARVDVGAVLKLLGGVDDALTGFGRDGLGDRRVVEDDGDGGRGEVEILGENLECDGSTCVWNALLPGGHLAPNRAISVMR